MKTSPNTRRYDGGAAANGPRSSKKISQSNCCGYQNRLFCQVVVVTVIVPGPSTEPPMVDGIIV
eukprot:6811026-Ditylum_brightwellii.AAC.1